MNPDYGDPAAAGYSWISRCSSPRLTMAPLQNAFHDAFPLVGPALYSIVYRTGGQDQQAWATSEEPNLSQKKRS